MAQIENYEMLAGDAWDSLIPACLVVDAIVQEERDETDDEGPQ